jgi:hypothetical protein
MKSDYFIFRGGGTRNEKKKKNTNPSRKTRQEANGAP